MQPLKSFMGAGLIALAVPATAANVSVAFVHPEKYADAGYSHSFASERDRAEVQHDIEQHLQRLAERGLPASDALKSRCWTSTWPATSSHSGSATAPTLTRGDQLVASAEENLSDMNFLMSANRYSSGDRLRYEKAMLDDWFEKRITKR